MQKKLLIFHSALAPYRVNFFNSLSQNFRTTLVFARHNLLNQQFDQDRLKKQLCFTPVYLEKKITLKNRTLNWGYGQFIKRTQPDIVIGGEYNFSVLIPYLYKRIFHLNYTLYSICDDSPDRAKTSSGFHKWMRNFLVNRLDGLILVNEQTAQWYKKQYPKLKRQIVFPIIQEDTSFRERLKEALPFSKQYVEQYRLTGKKIFLFVGRFVELKGIDRIIKSFVQTNPDENTKLIIVGDGPSKNSLQNQALSSGYKENILFPGRFEDLELLAWYNIASCLILASESECFGAVVNEALLAGCKVLCTSTAGAVSLIVPQTNGEIFSPFDLTTLTHYIKEYSQTIPDINNKNINVRASLMPHTFEYYFRNILQELK